MNASVRPLVAEFLGTALFVLIAAGSIVANAMTAGGVPGVSIAFATGLGFAVLVSALMGISGGHLNPAISFGVWVAGKIDTRTCARYVLAQLLGGIAGAALLRVLLTASAVRAVSDGAPQLAMSIGFVQGVGLEAVFTFFLVSAVFGTMISGEGPKIGGFGAGLAVFVSMLVAGGLTGAALNPARAFGPALVSWSWHSQAVYWIGPLVGAAAAGWVWRVFLLPEDVEKKA